MADNMLYPKLTLNRLYPAGYLFVQEYIAEGEGGGIGEVAYELWLQPEGEGGGLGHLVREYLLTISGQGGGLGEADYQYVAALVEFACLVLNLNSGRTYQFSAYDFDGIGRFQGKLIGLRDGTIYDLETETLTDGDEDINAYIEIQTDFGIKNQKQLRAMFLQDDSATVTITDSDGNVITKGITPKAFQSMPKNLVDKYFTIRIANSAGQKITLRRHLAKINVLDKKGGIEYVHD